MKDNGETVRLTDLGYIFIALALVIREIGRMINSMGTGLRLGPMERDMREATNTETNMAKVVFSGAMVAAM